MEMINGNDQDSSKIASNFNQLNQDRNENRDDDSTSTNEEKDGQITTDLEGVYDSSKYECPNVPSQVKNLFSFIQHYSPQVIEIGPRLKPFIPDYIPTVGHVDAFIKIPYPDARSNILGMTVLDEPDIEQSDAVLLQMKLRALSKEMGRFDQTTLETATVPVVPLIGSGSSLAKEIDKWIGSMQLLHETSSRPESIVHLMHQQPENIDNLMQEWPEELETTLNVHSIPSAELDCSLDEYITIISAILDVPIKSNKIVSLYCIFTVLNEFQNSQHFNKYDK